MIKVWAGEQSHDYRYIKRSIPSLLRCDLPDSVRIVLIDDQCTDTRVPAMLAEWAKNCGSDRNGPTIQVWRNPERMGPNRGQEYNFARLVDQYPEAELYAICDDDIVYHPQWLNRLVQVYQEAKTAGIKGVFTALNVPYRPHYGRVTLPTSEVLLKERQAALNWLLPRQVYEEVGPFRDTGTAYDTEYCDRLAKHNLPVICLKPSYVQNIGYFGAYQCSNEYTAKDFVGNIGFDLRVREVLFQVRRTIYRIGSPVKQALLRRSSNPTSNQ